MRVTSNFNTYSITNKNNRKLPQATTNTCGVFSSKNAKNEKQQPNFKCHLIELKLKENEKNKIEKLIRNYYENNKSIEFVGKGTFGTVYKITLDNRKPIAVKILSQDYEQMYGGGNLKKEAENLKIIPRDCTQTQHLIDYYNKNQKDYLVTTFIDAKSLSRKDELTQKHYDNIVKELFKYDINGLMFFDLNPNNILEKDGNIGFIDFEYAETNTQTKANFDALNDTHHLNRNIYYPQKSNINSFENRSLGRIIQRFENKGETEKSTKQTELYLKSLSKYHKNKAKFFEQKNISTKKAIDYEKILSNLYKSPSKEIIAIEKDLINLKYTTLNYHLYLHRKNEGKLLDDDVENYGNFDKYINKMNMLATNTKSNILKLSQNTQDKNIKLYCETNLLLINHFLLKNTNKNYYEVRAHNEPKKLEKKANEIISKLECLSNTELSSELNDFRTLKNKILIQSNNDNKYKTYCKNIEICLLNTIKLATNKM